MAEKIKKKKRNRKKDIEETLPLTEGDGSIYRKDEVTGKINLEKVVSGATAAVQKFKIVKPKVEGLDYSQFIEAFKNITISEEEFRAKYQNEDIEKVNKGGVIGNIANKIIKDKYGEQN